MGLVLLAAAVTLGAVAVRDLQRLDRIHVRMQLALQLHRLSIGLVSAVVDRSGATIDTVTLRSLSADIAELTAFPDGRDTQTMERLTELRGLFENQAPLTEARLTRALQIARELTTADLAAQERLFESTRRDAEVELQLTLAIMAALVMLSTLGWWIVHRRFLKPLEDLRELFTLLANSDFRAVATEHIEPILIPLFQNYNYLVTRLQTLEQDHQSRARSLQDEVRRATQALLEQHRSLADAERLAVVGEMAAGVAHELRNPLAGISMSLGNLRQDVADPDVVERLDAIVAEIDRVTRLLGQYLATARHAPEPPRSVDIAALIGDLLELLRYQVPEHVTLHSQVPKSLPCTLPRDRIRQVLLNLVLNAVQALDQTPGSVVIDAHRNGERLHISVTDEGPGFPPEQLAAPARAFVTRREAGTGLGLVMVRRFVEDLGGELQLQNREPHGARITLMLPYANG
ncbi:MAG: ATP-binding protein [Gemmatimonadales bacterium]